MRPPDHHLLAVSHRYGGDPAYVLAGGGNTSVKSADRLWVKASGHALATIAADGFVELDRAALDRMLTATAWPAEPKPREALFIERVMAARTSPELGQRPSVEALLHHLLPDRLVVHTHPGVVNAVTCCTRGREIAAELFGDEVLWQPYVDPGLTLAQSLRAAMAGRKPIAILLQNHGLIVGGETAEAIADTSDRIVGVIKTRVDAKATPVGWASADLAPIATAISAARPHLHVRPDDSFAATWLASTEAGLSAAIGGPLTPDQIVYCRSVPMVIEPGGSWEAAWSAYEAKHGLEPWVALVVGAGIVAVRQSLKMAEVTRAVYADAAAVSLGADRLGGVRHLGPRDRQFIEGWEVEAHRRAVMSRPA